MSRNRSWRGALFSSTAFIGIAACRAAGVDRSHAPDDARDLHDARPAHGGVCRHGRMEAGLTTRRWARRSRPIYYFDIIHDYPSIGGVVEFSQILFGELKRRYGARLVSARAASARLGLADTHMPYLDRERRVARMLADADPDATFFFPNFHSPIARRTFGPLPKIVNVVHDVQFAFLPELFDRAHLAWLHQACAETRENADEIVFVSQTSRDQFIRCFGQPKRCRVIYNPVRAGKAGSERNTAAPFLLTAAHSDHHPHKNVEGLLRLFAALAAGSEDLQLYATGHGRETFQRALELFPENVRQRVDHLGHVPRAELDRLHGTAQAYVSLSRFEGFNMSAAEAASHGTPLILSDLPVHRELFGPQACFVDPLAPSVDDVLRFLNRKEERHASAWRHRATCSPEHVGAAYARVIESQAREDAQPAEKGHRRQLAFSAASQASRTISPALRSALGTMLSGSATGIALALAMAATTAMAADGGAGGGNAGGAGGTLESPNGQDGGSNGGGGGGASTWEGTASGSGGEGSFGAGGAGGAPGYTGDGAGLPPGDISGLAGGGGGSAPGSFGVGGGGGGGYGVVIRPSNPSLSLGSQAIDQNISGGAGGAGGSAYFGGGGGGGGGGGLYFGGSTGDSLNLSGVVQGGNGGNGGDTVDGGSGAGGDGGEGVWLNGGALTVSGSIRGGNGGFGGGGGSRGSGGDGGAGVRADGGGVITLSAGGSIEGGVDAFFAADGAGIVGADLTVITAGQIVGGLSLDGLTRANAINFTGGTNRLELRYGYSFVGNVAANGASNTLALGGVENASFDVGGVGSQFIGFEAFEKVGANTWTLTGSTSAVTPWTISVGTLSISDDAQLGDSSGGLTFNGGTLQTNAAFSSSRNVVLAGSGIFQTDANLALTGDISGSGLFTKQGAGTLTLSGDNTYTGGTRILGGTLEARGGNAIGDQSSVIAQTGQFRVLDNETIGTLSGNTGTVELTGADLTTSTNFANVTALFFGGITGTGGLIKNGAYRQVLAGGNSYQGATQILGGTLSAVGAGIDSIPDASAVTVASGATLSLVQPFPFAGLESDDETIGSLSGAGHVNLGDGKLTIDGADSTTFSGGISGAGGSLTKAGAGTLTLTGTNTYTGETTIGAGALEVSGGVVNHPTSDMVVGAQSGDNGALRIINGGSVSNRFGIVGNGAGSDGNATVTGPGSTWTNSASLVIGGEGTGALTIENGGTVSNTTGFAGAGPGSEGSVTVIGPGSAWTNSVDLVVGLNGTGTLTIADGGTASNETGTVGSQADSEGSVTVAGADSTWTNSGALFIGDLGTGTLNIADDGVVNAGTVSIAGQSGSTGTLNIGAAAGDAATAAGTLEAPSIAFGAGASTINFNHTKTGYEFASAVSGDGSVNVLAGTTIFTGDNSYTGLTTIAGGATLQIGNGGSIASDVANNGALIFDRTGTLTYGGGISGSGTLTKTGAGTLTLKGNNTYAGATNVNGGTLQVDGSLGSTATTVANGATLGGSGSIAGPVTVQDGGTLAPGSSAGTLTVGSLSLSGGSVLDYELGQAGVVGGGVNDLIEVTGNLILDGTLNITDIGGFGPGVYRLMNYGGNLADHVLELGGLPTGVDASDLYVQTRIVGQVNLINSAGAALNFWDGGDVALHDNGANDGGSGVWDAASRNWTEADGAPNGQWNQDFAIFGGTAGTVTVDNSAGAVQFTGMQFMTDGYVINGEALTTNTAETIIRVDAGVSATIAAAITGTGGLVKQDTGTLVLAGANSYAGGTSMLNGTLQVSADANLGDASGNLTLDGGTLRNTAAFTTARNITLGDGGGTFETNADLTATGVVSGAGALTKIGGGTLTLSGVNTYAGGTAVSQGRVTAAVTGALGTGPVTIDAASGGSAVIDFAGSASAGSLAIGLADPDSYLSFLQNASAGDAAINNSGRINFYDDSSAGGATITNFGPGTSFGDNSNAGDATIINNAGSPLNFYHQASAGNATIINNGGFTIFNGDNTADGATITNNGGVVDISPLTTDGIGIGSLSGGGVVFLGSKILALGGLGENGTVSGIIADSGIAGGTGGALTKVGAGTLTLTGANSYTGGTTVEAGRLDIGAGGATGSIAGDVDVLAGGTLALNRSDDFTFAGLIGGDGTVEKLAAGTLTLTGDSNAFAGTTTVNAGTLAVNGTLGGVVDVLSGGRLEGTGTVGTTTVASGGTIAPGNSIDTLSVAGDITFAAGSTYEVEIEPDLDGDLIDASGAATIDGGTVHVLKTAGTYTPGSRWTIVSADGGVAGEFDDLTQNMPFVDLALAYDPNNVYLDVTRNDVSFCDVALTFNQCSTGDGVESTGPGTPIYDVVAAIPDEESARQALDALSGEIHASIKGAFLEDSRFVREAMLDRTRAALGGVAAPSLPVMGYGSESLTPEQQEALAREGKSARVFAPAPADTDRFAVWARGFGSWGQWDSDGNAADFERSTGGIFVGADAAVAETWRVGLVTGYSRSSFHVDDRASSGDSDNYHLGLFGGTSFGNLGLSLGAAHTWHDIETGREIAFPGFADSAETSYDARTAQVFGELGYRIAAGNFAFEPFGNLAYVNVDTDGFAEDGGAAALTGAGGTSDATFTTLGLRAATDFRLGGMTATARGMLGWRHAFGDTVPNSTHAFAGGDAFTIAGTPIAEDALVLEAGLDVGLSQKTSLGLSYSGQIGAGAGASDHGFRADLSVKF